MFKENNEANNIETKNEEKKLDNVLNSSTNLKDRQKQKEKSKRKEKKEILPKVKISKIFKYPTSIYSFFLISFGLFFLSCNAALSEYGSSSLSVPFLIIGIIQYILGIYDYYQGNTYLFIQNIIFGIRYINFFLNYFELNGLKRTKIIFSNMQGIIDFIVFAFLSVFTIVIKGENLFYFILYFFLTITTAFFILSGFADGYKTIIKITGYFLFFSSVCFWITGLSLVINDTFKKKIIKLVEPRIK